MLRGLDLFPRDAILNLTISLRETLTFARVFLWYLSFLNGHLALMAMTAFIMVIDTQQAMAIWKIAFPAFW